MDYGFPGAHSGSMETFESLVRAEFAPKNTYLNTASTGLLPARTVAAIRRAAREHGTRTYIDASQAAGWLDFDADAHDYSASVAFKWLVCPRGVAFLVVPEDLGGLPPLFAGWVAGERPWDACYGPIDELAHSARRFDESPALFSYAGARHSLELLEELGTDAVRAHDLALADRFRAGLASLGH